MVRLYIDLETYRPKKEEAFINEKIILAGFLIDETPYSEVSLKINIEPILLKEWDKLDEKMIVSRLEEYIKGAIETYRFTVICGFNVLRFDIPLLICKSTQYSLEKPEIISKMWHDCFVIDYFQELLMANNNLFKGLKLENIVHVAKKFELKAPPISGKGEEIKDLYEQSKWKEIEEHNKQDLKIIRWLDLYGAKQLMNISMKQKQPLFYE